MTALSATTESREKSVRNPANVPRKKNTRIVLKKALDLRDLRKVIARKELRTMVKKVIVLSVRNDLTKLSELNVKLQELRQKQSAMLIMKT